MESGGKLEYDQTDDSDPEVSITLKTDLQNIYNVAKDCEANAKRELNEALNTLGCYITVDGNISYAPTGVDVNTLTMGKVINSFSKLPISNAYNRNESHVNGNVIDATESKFTPTVASMDYTIVIPKGWRDHDVTMDITPVYQTMYNKVAECNWSAVIHLGSYTPFYDDHAFHEHVEICNIPAGHNNAILQVDGGTWAQSNDTNTNFTEIGGNGLSHTISVSATAGNLRQLSRNIYWLSNCQNGVTVTVVSRGSSSWGTHSTVGGVTVYVEN